MLRFWACYTQSFLSSCTGFFRPAHPVYAGRLLLVEVQALDVVLLLRAAVVVSGLRVSLGFSVGLRGSKVCFFPNTLNSAWPSFSTPFTQA